MAFTNEKRWPVGFRPDPMEEKPPAMNCMAAWPTSSAANFSRLAQEPGVKMIVTPKAYHATHDTMPPPNQVIMVASTHSVMKEHYQAADRKVGDGWWIWFLAKEGTENRIRRVLNHRSSFGLVNEEMKPWPR